jgi:hypothetical protein
MITGRPQVDERSSSMRPVARQRMNPTSSHPEVHPRPSPHHERAQHSHHPKRGSHFKKELSAFFVALGVCCWLIRHWSHYSTMVLLIENRNLLHQNIATGAPRKNKNHSVSSVASVNPPSSPRDKAKKPSRNKAKKPSRDPSEVRVDRGPIFYNVYVPDTKIENVKKIVREQLEECKAMDPNSIIIYTLIANKHADTIEALFNSTCPNCQQRTKVSFGDEVDTLRALWEYCSSDAVPSTTANDTLVSYIHDKGSFHFNHNNNRARRKATRSTLACRQQMPSKPFRCNICASQFQVVPQYHGSAKYVDV